MDARIGVIIFTGAGEWVASGVPLTPGHLEIQQQTKIGSLPERWVPPRDVDGATLFIARNGNEVREFLFADTEQAYQAGDLALLSRHLINGPVDQDFDQVRRQLLIVMGDGSLAAVTVDRNSDVVAWSRHETHQSRPLWMPPRSCPCLRACRHRARCV